MSPFWPIAEVPEHVSASARRVKHHCFVSQFIFIYFSRTPISNRCPLPRSCVRFTHQAPHRTCARENRAPVRRSVARGRGRRYYRSIARDYSPLPPRQRPPALAPPPVACCWEHGCRDTQRRCTVRAPGVVPLCVRADAAPATANNNQIASGQRFTATRPGRSPSGSHWRRAPARSGPDSPAYCGH